MFVAVVDNEVINLDPKDPDPVPEPEKRRMYERRPVIRCRGCGGRAHMRSLASPSGDLMVFAHNPGEAQNCRALGYHVVETEGHHDLKSRLAAAARKAGWTAELEVYGNKCRADVVATSPSGRSRWVLEAQLAPIKAPELVDRTGRYSDQFGKVTWTHQGRRAWSNTHEGVECLRVADDDLATVVGGVMLDQAGTTVAPPTPVDDVIPRILRGGLTYVYGTSFGYYLDLAAVANAANASRRQRDSRRPGSSVQECGRRVGERVPCVWCGQLTARDGHDGAPRHIWCEDVAHPLFRSIPRPTGG